MTLSGHPAWEIIARRARATLVFTLLAVPICLATATPLVAGLVGVAVAAGLLLMATRILAYRIHARRTADLVVGGCAMVVIISGAAMPVLMPFVAAAILWQLSRRAAAMTWRVGRSRRDAGRQRCRLYHPARQLVRADRCQRIGQDQPAPRAGRPERVVLTAAAAALAGFAVALAQPDHLPAVRHVEQVLFSSFAVHPLAGVAVVLAMLLMIAPAWIGYRRDRATGAPWLVFGAVWLGVIAAAALGNYPTPLVGYGGSAIIGYVLGLAALPRRAAPA
eukprot:gene12784-17044_t